MNGEKKKLPAEEGVQQPQARQSQGAVNPEPQGEIPLQEQMMRRQSAPRPTAQDELGKIMAQRGGMAMQGGAMNGFKALAQVIGREQILAAQQVLQKYKEGKANLEKRIVENEEWYKLRHWECMRKKKDSDVQPVSGWLFNSIANKHADAMDNFPSPNILPREEGDKGEAEMLTSIVPVILDQCEFEQVYSDVWNYKLKTGTGVYGVFWDGSKLGGLGDISIKKVDIINLFWESGIQDIQMSRNFFHVELADNDVLMGMYPQLVGKLSTPTVSLAKYSYDDNVDTTNKSVVVDWYYKKAGQGGKTVLHYCKYVGDVVLFATENDPDKYPNGWYDHGLYPFVFDTLYPVQGTPCGFGFIDIGKDAQAYIDRGNQAVLENMIVNASPRYFASAGSGVNEEEFCDLSKKIVHVEGNVSDSFAPVQANPLNNIYLQVLMAKVDELKETTGNRDISTGGTTSGVTAASAIAAMQEAGSKLSRDNNKASYRAFRKICLMIIELIRQFYGTHRCFRIMGENGVARFVQYSNAGITPKHQGIDFGSDMGYRLPLFDIEVTAQKASPYSKMSQNELALQFYSAGFFNPQIADQALACLDMMDFDRKHFVMQKIAQNGGMYQQMLAMQQQMLMLAQMVDQSRGGNEVSTAIAAQFGMEAPPAAMGGGGGEALGKVEETEALGGDGSGEAANTKKARQRVADSTAPA